MSSCQNISHVGLSSLTSGAEGLQQLTLGYGSPVIFCTLFFIVIFEQFFSDPRAHKCLIVSGHSSSG
jgi:hypothetical protein